MKNALFILIFATFLTACSNNNNPPPVVTEYPSPFATPLLEFFANGDSNDPDLMQIAVFAEATGYIDVVAIQGNPNDYENWQARIITLPLVPQMDGNSIAMDVVYRDFNDFDKSGFMFGRNGRVALSTYDNIVDLEITFFRLILADVDIFEIVEDYTISRNWVEGSFVYSSPSSDTEDSFNSWFAYNFGESDDSLIRWNEMVDQTDEILNMEFPEIFDSEWEFTGKWWE